MNLKASLTCFITPPVLLLSSAKTSTATVPLITKYMDEQNWPETVQTFIHIDK